MPAKIDAYYQCDECKMNYRSLELAEKCEVWCKEHHTCNIEIVKYAVGNYGTVSTDPLKLYVSNDEAVDDR